MTTSIPLDQLPSPTDDARRDQWGRYLVVPPGGSKPVGYTRVTTVAKTLDDGGGLAPWKAAMCAQGMIMRRGLRAQWEALLAQYSGDPWYADEAGKKACKALVEDCAAVGGANDRREMGSSLHTITALVDVGRQPQHLTEETERDILAYVDGMAAAGIVILPGMVELTVVLDDWRVAGTFDRLVTVPGFDLPMIADLKTGNELSYSWQSIAVQLAAYSRADAIYIQGTAEDGSQDVRRPMPAVDQDHGLILWLNAGTGRLEFWLVDIAEGWMAFDLSMRARGWRKHEVATELSHYTRRLAPDADLTKLLEDSIAQVEANKDRGVGVVADAVGAQHPDPMTDDYQPAFVRDWLQQRIEVIGRMPAARADLKVSWPPNLPSLRSGYTHSSSDLDLIEQVLDQVEARHQIPFGTSKPTREDAVGELLHLFPNSTLSTEDDPA